MRIRHWFFVACAAIAVLSAAGCKRAGQSAADAAIAAASGGKVDVNHGDDGTTTIATKDGKQTMTVSAGAALPASFPRDVYLPSDYKVESAMEMPNAVIAHVLTPGNLGAIAPEADRAMQAQGWTQSMLLVQSEQAHIVMWEKGERHATLTIAGDEAQGGVQVGYQLATSKQ
jgi:hypothetical protein